MKKVSSSFVAGAIALVFAVLGYQTALLIHHAAVGAIAAHRDKPDTVYVEASPESPASGVGRPSQGAAAHRQNSQHGSVAAQVRSSAPVRKVENFRFNPNTVSEEDLLRLGFTPRQAQGILNYRSKGGKFKRKEDFARSYSVPDSVFARLEKYIDIPKLDINKADSASFDALPGIGGYFARKMVEHRQALGGYSYAEQLMDIYHFDQEKFDAVKDLICVSSPKPYPLWTLPADSLRMHPYINNMAVARAIVLYRMHNPKERWTVEDLARSGVISAQNSEKLSRCCIAFP